MISDVAFKVFIFSSWLSIISLITFLFAEAIGV